MMFSVSKESKNEGQLITNRRGFLKAAIPGGWISEYRRRNHHPLSAAAKASMVKDAALLALFSPALISCSPSPDQSQAMSLKEKVLDFKWQNVEKAPALESFTRLLAEEYLRLTQSPRLTPQRLTAPNQTNFFRDQKSYVAAVKQVVSDYVPGNQWGYTHFASGLVFIDLETLQRQSRAQSEKAGLALLDALWHEWGHLDVEEKDQGKFLKNPVYYFKSPVTRQNEVFLKYRGGEIFTQTYYGFLRFAEVWNEAITVRRMIEQVGLEEVISAGDYYQNGISFFPALTIALEISLDNLYRLHANSSFEEFAQMIGDKLPGSEPSSEKGVRLFLGIHQGDEQLIKRSGALEIIKNKS